MATDAEHRATDVQLLYDEIVAEHALVRLVHKSIARRVALILTDDDASASELRTAVGRAA